MPIFHLRPVHAKESIPGLDLFGRSDSMKNAITNKLDCLIAMIKKITDLLAGIFDLLERIVSLLEQKKEEEDNSVGGDTDKQQEES
jgi:hypothetical protein